jgi:hypothetical protein
MRFIPSKLNSTVLESGLPDLLVDPRCESRKLLDGVDNHRRYDL